MNEEQRISRRTFLDWLLAGGLLTWAVAFVAPVISYVWPAQKRGPSIQTASAGKADEFAEWQTKIVAIGGHPVIVIRTPQGFRAFSAICTHLGCIVGWDAARHQIACPCHAGFFDINGRPVAGPPPQPLAEHGVAVVNGEVLVKSA
ncbi:MAG TPA: Rieske (2Fe-2S) protein [Verrucomicrobiae bacterium]|nr:Rieske (2Fe-2S) protein [Verrucomicrobiae bacterium]